MFVDSVRTWGRLGIRTAPGMDKEQLQARTRRFALAVIRLAPGIRALAGTRSVADQLVDAATSIGANYRSACRARSRREFIAKLGIVVEEADEAVHWLELIEDAGIGPADRVPTLIAEARELRAIFAASVATARRNYKSQDH
ncbi:MAG: four helix bundle protein [Vicinamibacterales bacterium]